MGTSISGERHGKKTAKNLPETFPDLRNLVICRACRDSPARAAHEDGFLQMHYNEGEIFRVVREELTDDGSKFTCLCL